MHRSHRSGPGVAALCGAAFVAVASGCAASSATASTAVPPPVSSTPRGSPGDAPPARCAAVDLTVTLGPDILVGAAQRQLPIVMTNRSARPCTVTGYPGVRLVAEDGSGYDPHRSPLVPPTRVVLTPGSTARANLRYLPTEPGESGAFVPTRVLLTPPGTVTSVALTWDRGPVLDQSGATRPGTYIMAFEAG